MNSATRYLSALAAFAVFTSFCLSSCTTLNNLEPGGAVGWISDGFRLSDEPPKDMPDPAIQKYRQSTGILSYKWRTLSPQDRIASENQ